MLRSLKKAAQSLERNVNEAFSTAPSTHTTFVNTVLHIGPHSLRLGPVFAEGGFSFVHIATPLNLPSTSPLRYAVKRMPCPDPDAQSAARREIALLNALPPHPNIVAFHGAVFQDAHAFLLFDLIDGGTVPEVLSRPTTHFPPDKLLAIFADAVAAVVHLHAQSPPLAVRDVKLENLLYDRLAHSYKLCDFGSASAVAKRFLTRKEILDAEEDVANSCSAMYRAPEIADVYTKQFVCEKVDVWALGCVWYALLFGDLPFDGSSSLQILKGLTTVPDDPTYPQQFIDMLSAMLTVSPADRVDSFTLLEQVRMLQGRHIEPELRQIGRTLREQRARDFAGEAADMPTKTHADLLSFETTPAPTPKARSGGAAAFPRPQAFVTDFQRGQTGSDPVSATAAPQQDDGWADFEAAFGAGPPAAAPAIPSTSTTGSWPPVSNLATSSAPSRPLAGTRAAIPGLSTRSDSSKANTTSNAFPVFMDTAPSARTARRDTSEEGAATSLIDFSDLQISPSKSKSTSTNDSVKTTAPRTTAAGSTPDFSDLIDFGSG